jgi:PAS domain S-box-containing protein
MTGEIRRLEALRQYHVLDTPPEPALDDLTTLAAEICNVPIALISLLDENRQWFKAKVGLKMSETPRDISFCAHAIRQREIFIVPDATRDERFAGNPLVTGTESIRFYAGAPLIGPDDLALGALGIMDHLPRVLSPAQKHALRILGRQVMTHLELRKHTRELSESEERLRIVTRNARVGLVMINRERRYIYANEAYAEILRLPSSEIVGQRVADVLPEIYEQEVRPFQDRAFAGERVAYDLLKPAPDRDRDFTVRYEPTFVHGEVASVVASVTDITERTRNEERIVEQAALLDKARDAILVRDLEGKILFWNKGAERMYGYTREQAVGRKIAAMLYPDPELFEQLNAVTLEQGEWNGEIRHLTRNRGEITIEARWTVIRDAEGKPKSVLAINTDITEKKKIEAQFMRAQRMESIGTLAGGIAHDLNNILAPIMMAIDLLKPLSQGPEAAEILETMEISAKRGADIVGQVLSFARGLEGERIEIQPKHLLRDLEKIIKDTMPKDIRLQFDIPNGLWTLLGDPTQVHQILLNLCVNARDAMPNGGGLTVGVENYVLDEQYAAMNIQAKPGRYVMITVTDSGTGIPPELLDKIFEPFFTTKELNKGTGLGLSTVMAIVKSHDGVINVYSEPGRGSTFRIYLPALAGSLGEGKAAHEPAALPRGNGETVLVVDDEASVLTVTSQTLQAFGYGVLTATDGADAVAIYAQHRAAVAVVLTDMMMPVMDGPLTIHALMRINPEVKIIAASGLVSNGNAAKASGVGVKHFLMKPYTAGTLLKTLRLVLDAK